MDSCLTMMTFVLLITSYVAGVKDLDWNEIAYQGGHVDFDHEPNIIVASDIVFDGADAGPLCTTLHKIFARYGDRCELILANAMRNADTQKKFFDKLGECEVHQWTF